MSAHFLYTQEIKAVIPPESWDEAYFALLSLKHALAGVPGWKRMDTFANNDEDGTIDLVVITNWAFVSQLRAWLKSDLTVEGVLKSLTPPPTSIEVNFYEKMS